MINKRMEFLFFSTYISSNIFGAMVLGVSAHFVSNLNKMKIE